MVVEQPPFGMYKTHVNNGIFTIYQLVQLEKLCQDMGKNYVERMFAHYSCDYFTAEVSISESINTRVISQSA